MDDDAKRNKPSERLESLQEHLSATADGTDVDKAKREVPKDQQGQGEEATSWASTTSEQPHKTTLFVDVQTHQWPIVYSPEYNIGFLGMEKLHPFDSGKWGKVYGFLKGM